MIRFWSALPETLSDPRNLHVPVNSAVFVHETHTLSSLFPDCPVKINLRVFISNNLAEFH